ncbi:MAG: hypothetical protein QXR53_05020, partial [Candidatus Norongarragalinales archaeon]
KSVREWAQFEKKQNMITNKNREAFFSAVKELLTLCNRQTVFCPNAENALVELIGEGMANEGLALFSAERFGLGSREAANLVVSFMDIQDASIVWDNNISFGRRTGEFGQQEIVKISHPSWKGSWHKINDSWIFNSNV